MTLHTARLPVLVLAVLLLTISLAGPARTAALQEQPTAVAENQTDPSVSPVRPLAAGQARPVGLDGAPIDVVGPEGALLIPPALVPGVSTAASTQPSSPHWATASGSRAPPASS